MTKKNEIMENDNQDEYTVVVGQVLWFCASAQRVLSHLILRTLSSRGCAVPFLKGSGPFRMDPKRLKIV